MLRFVFIKLVQIKNIKKENLYFMIQNYIIYLG